MSMVPTNAATQAAPVPSMLVVGSTLVAIRLSLKVLDFGRSIRLVRDLAARAPSPADGTSEFLSGTVRAVAKAGAFFPGRAICLEQSLTLYLLLRHRGVPAELRIGVQPYPFHAHAWVECDGEPINEVREVVNKFVLLPELAR
jgi:hypothetical protein